MPRKFRTNLTAERVRELLNYDPETGVFTWKVDRVAGRPATNIRARAGDIAGNINAWGYRVIGIDGCQSPAHRLAWLHVYGEWPHSIIDHANGDRSDNRLENLRLADDSANLQNMRLHDRNKCGFKGVHKTDRHSNRPWIASITVRGKTHYLGSHETPEEAHEAYKAAARKFFGEFARFE